MEIRTKIIFSVAGALLLSNLGTAATEPAAACELGALAGSPVGPAEKAEKLKLEVAWLRNDRERILKYQTEGKLFGFPNAFVVFSLMEDGLNSKVTKSEMEEVFEKSLTTLGGLLDPGLLKKPDTAEQAEEQARKLSEVVERLKSFLKASYGTANWDDWMTPEKVLDLTRLFQEFRADPNANPKDIWNQLTEARPLTIWNYGGHWGAPSISIFRIGQYEVGIVPRAVNPDWWPGNYYGTWSANPPDPAALLKKREGKGWFAPASAQSRIGSYEGKMPRQLADLEKKLAQREQELTALLGKVTKEPHSPYTAPGKLAQALDEKPKPKEATEASEFLVYQEALLKTYFSEGGFFTSPFAKSHLMGASEGNWDTVYHDQFETFAPSWIPQAEEGKGYDPVKLSAYREHLNKLGLDSETFARYSRELAALKADYKAFHQMQDLTLDYRNGLKKLKAMRSVMGEKAEPPGGSSTPPHERASEATPPGYVRPLSVAHGLHEALTALSRETARRGNDALPQQLLAASNTAGQSLHRALGKGKLSRDLALEVLAPPLQAASEEAVALARDFSTMEGDLQMLRQRMETELKATAEKAKATAEEAKRVPAGTPESYVMASRLEDASLEIDELQTQLTGVDQLANTLKVLRQNLVQTRDFVTALQKRLHFVNPQAPNAIDNTELAATLKKLDAMVKQK